MNKKLVIIVNEDYLDGLENSIDQRIYTTSKLSAGAAILYGYLYYSKISNIVNDEVLKRNFDTTQKTLTNRKNELINLGLMITTKIGPGIYIMFIGSFDNPAKVIEEKWKKINNQ